jgi:hypothetical protein
MTVAQREEIIALQLELEATKTKLAQLHDCGQEGVCKLSPGCVRHFAERNRELVTELAQLRTAATEAGEATFKLIDATTRTKALLTERGCLEHNGSDWTACAAEMPFGEAAWCVVCRALAALAEVEHE